jgi:hypothetical protein
MVLVFEFLLKRKLFMDVYLEDAYSAALTEFPALIVHEGTEDFEPVLYLAIRLMGGDMLDEIETDIEDVADWYLWVGGASFVEASG